MEHLQLQKTVRLPAFLDSEAKHGGKLDSRTLSVGGGNAVLVLVSIFTSREGRAA